MLRQKTQTPPGPRSLSPLGSVHEITQDPIQFTLNCWKTYGDIVRIRFLHQPATLLYHPDYAKHVLQENYQNYNKQIPLIRALSVLLGNGLFTSDGDLWRKQRRLMQPIFHRKHLPTFAGLVETDTRKLIEQWEPIEKDHHPIDISKEMLTFIMKVIGHTLFSVETKAEAIEAYMDAVMPLVGAYVNIPFPPIEVPTRRNRRIRQGISKIDALIYEMIEKYRASEQKTVNLLSLLLEARNEQDGTMSDQQVHDELITFLLGGHETTARTLGWCLYILATRPDIEEELHHELDTVLHGTPPTLEGISQLSYLQMLVQEVLRVYPPAFVIARHVDKNDTIGGYHIPGNSTAFVSPYVIHRHPEYWDAPEEFRPTRFEEQVKERKPHKAYLPFGAGPHICIGNHFGLMIVHIVLASLTQHYQFRLVPGHTVGVEFKLTLRPNTSLPMTITRR